MSRREEGGNLEDIFLTQTGGKYENVWKEGIGQSVSFPTQTGGKYENVWKKGLGQSGSLPSRCDYPH